MMSGIYEEFCKLRDQRRHGEEAPEHTEKRAFDLALAQHAQPALAAHAASCANTHPVLSVELAAQLDQQPAPVARQKSTLRTVLAMVLEWEELERISNIPAVHEALQGFSEDPTGDNGVYIVREILRAVAPAAAERAGSSKKAGGAA